MLPKEMLAPLSRRRKPIGFFEILGLVAMYSYQQSWEKSLQVSLFSWDALVLDVSGFLGNQMAFARFWQTCWVILVEIPPKVSEDL